MQLNPSEISELIRSRIQNLDMGAEVRTQGTVVSVTDGICRIHGLSNAMQGEMLEFPGNTFGLALNLERDSVGAVILGEYEHITEGDPVKCTGRILAVPVGPELLGRVVNSLGQPIDGKGPIDAKATDVIEKVAPGVIADRIDIRHVAGGRHGMPAELGDRSRRLSQTALVDVGKQQVGAGAGHRERDGAAHAAGRPGHDGHAAGQIEPRWKRSLAHLILPRRRAARARPWPPAPVPPVPGKRRRSRRAQRTSTSAGGAPAARARG